MKFKQLSALILSLAVAITSFSTTLTANGEVITDEEASLSNSALEADSETETEDNNSDETSEFAGGNGTEENPYQVATAKQLDAVRNDLEASYIQTADIDLSGTEWIPIGYNSSEGTTDTFSGQYNGNGYNIYNMTISDTQSNIYYIGLFAVSSDSLKNITLKDININLNFDMPKRLYIGAVVGAASGSLSDLYASGTIDVDGYASTSGVFVGGIVGYNSADTITNCENHSNINVLLNMYSQYSTSSGYCGGISGHSLYDTPKKCVNYGTIDFTSYGHVYCGGINGYGNAEYCVNYGDIYAESTGSKSVGANSHSNAGGVVGFESGSKILHYSGYTTDNCVNFGNVSSIYKNAAACAGGVIGGGYSGTTGFPDIYRCYNMGKTIIGTGRAVGAKTGTLSEIYSVDTAAVNGEIPEESEIGSDTIHGESMSEEDILEAVQYILDYISGGLEAESIDYEADIIKTAANSILAGNLSVSGLGFEVKVKFNREIRLTSGGNIWLLPNVEGEVVLPDNRPSAECIDVYDYRIEESDGTADTLVIEVPINNIYDGISYLTGKTLTLYVDGNVIEPSDENIQFDSLAFEIDTKNYALDYSEDVFRWDNSNTNFGCEHYDISSSLAGRLNIDAATLANYRYTMEWGGSCFGMSSIVGMIKNGYFSLDNIITDNEIENVKGLPLPVNSTGKSGVRDWVNYVQLLQYDEDIKSNYQTTFYVKGFFKGLTNIILGTSCKDGLRAVVNNAENNPAKYILSYTYDENGVDKTHAILPFCCYADNEESMYRIVCYDCSASDCISVVSVDYDYSSCKVSSLDSDITTVILQ